MRSLLARLRAKLKRLNGSANVGERMSTGAHQKHYGTPHGGSDGWAGGGGLPPG